MNNNDERDYAEEAAQRAAMGDDCDPAELVEMPVTGGWLSGPCDSPTQPEPGSLGHALMTYAANATIGELAELGGRIIAGMTGDWDCAAYGPEVAALGALCFFSGGLGTRACLSRQVCETAMAAERVRLYDHMHALAAADPDGVWAQVAAEVSDPEQLLGGRAERASGPDPCRLMATRPCPISAGCEGLPCARLEDDDESRWAGEQ